MSSVKSNVETFYLADTEKKRSLSLGGRELKGDQKRKTFQSQI